MVDPARAGAAPGAGVAVVALVASAGGLGAISTVLGAFGADIPAAIIVAQHLGGQGSTLIEILRRRFVLPINWMTDGVALRPGEVMVCPPRTAAEILPDGTVVLTGSVVVAQGPFDRLLTSLAASFGARAVAVVLTGMGKDGAAGARALRDAGGAILAQSEQTAQHPSMPRAAVDAGAVDLVLDVNEIGPVLAGVFAGGSLLQRASRPPASPG